MRLLHPGPDLFGGGRARRDQGRHPESCHGGPRRASRSYRTRVARADEREHLPLRRLFQHHRCHHRCGGSESMKSFTYERADTPAAATAAFARNKGARFIAGGTNLLDLMKLEIETPAHLIDVSRLGFDKIEETDAGGLRI